ncbi:MAG: HD domain-containing protein [Ginsengibacter sp.]
MHIECSKMEAGIFKLISSVADELKMPCYVIGGFVRDKLLQRPSKDADIVCLGDGILLAHKVADRFDPKPQVSFFKNFGTAQIKLYQQQLQALNNDEAAKNNDHYFEVEFVGARKESYVETSRKPTVQTGTLNEDLNRRDFTINTLALGLNKQNYFSLIDQFNGLAHLQQQLIKTPLEPSITFSDDPLRMMRAIRFATQLHFDIEDETFDAIKANAERIKIVSGERIADELNKIILAKKPSTGFDLLFKSGLLQIIFPQMVALVGAEYIDGKGHKDNFYHTLQVLDNIAEHTNELWLRWAAILHDIGKPATKRFEEGHGWTFHGHEMVGSRMVPKIFNALKLPQNDRMKYVKKLVELHLRPISLTQENITDSAIRRLLYDAGEDIEDLMRLCRADITSKNPVKVKRYLKNFDYVTERLTEVEASDKLRNWQPPITGEIIMKTFSLKPSRVVGDLKNAIREAILDGEIPNDYDSAFKYMLLKAAEFHIEKTNVVT